MTTDPLVRAENFIATIREMAIEGFDTADTAGLPESLLILQLSNALADIVEEIHSYWAEAEAPMNFDDLLREIRA